MVLRIIGWIMLSAVVVFVLVAGIGKLADLPTFRRSIESLQLIPDSATRYAAFGIAWLELILALCWLLGFQRVLTGTAIAVLILSFTSVYAYLLLTGKRPTCSCLGLLTRYIVLQDEGQSVVIRNGILLAAMGVGAILLYFKPRKQSATTPSGTGGVESNVKIAGSGFTIIELLVSIFILASLIALALPSLSKMRTASHRAVSEANLHSHAQVFNAYAQDYKETWPYFTDPKATLTVLRANNVEVGIKYFDAHDFWNFALGPNYYGSAFSKQFFAPSVRRDINTHFFYPCAFIARPEFWNPETRTGPQQWGPTKIGDVAFPSQKILMVDVTPLYEQAFQNADPTKPVAKKSNWTAVATVDGAARRVMDNEIQAGYPIGDGDFPGSAHNADVFGLHTTGGVRGRDLLK